jgi:hypothetical protein
LVVILLGSESLSLSQEGNIDERFLKISCRGEKQHEGGQRKLNFAVYTLLLIVL